MIGRRSRASPGGRLTATDALDAYREAAAPAALTPRGRREGGGSRGNQGFPRALQAAAAALGRRPRRAAACPGIPPAQLSHRSACFEPRRASEKFRRMVAPFPSPISRPQLSQTSTVLRAKSSLLTWFGLPLA